MTTLRSNRFDNIKLVLGKNVQETAQGFLKIPAFTARTGIQSYRMDDGRVVKEYRSEKEVFSQASMDSLGTAAVTNGHPSVMVSPDNAKELMVGYPFGGVRKEDDGEEKFLATDLIITHRSAIDAIKEGKAQLSNGYNVDLEFSEGEYKGQRYDAEQKNIINNHIAIVWRARGGEKVRLRLDSDQGILLNDQEPEIETPKQEPETMKVKIGDQEFEMSDEAGKAVMDMMKKNQADMKGMKEKKDSLETEVEVLKTQKSNFVAKVDSLESDLEKAKSERLDESELEKRVQSRISVMDSAKKLLSKEEIEKLDSMSDNEIKVAVIKVDSPKIDEEKMKDENYVNARYDHIVENFDASKEAGKKVGEQVQKERESKTDNAEGGYKSPDQIRKDKMKQAKEDSLGPINKK